MIISHRGSNLHDKNKRIIMEHLSEILSFIGGLLVGWTLKIILDRSKNSSVINGNKVGGDLAGRDINKK